MRVKADERSRALAPGRDAPFIPDRPAILVMNALGLLSAAAFCLQPVRQLKNAGRRIRSGAILSTVISRYGVNDTCDTTV